MQWHLPSIMVVVAKIQMETMSHPMKVWIIAALVQDNTMQLRGPMGCGFANIKQKFGVQSSRNFVCFEEKMATAMFLITSKRIKVRENQLKF